MIDFLYYRLWWPIRYWRCIFGHKWGSDWRFHEQGILYDAYVECLRCDAKVCTYDAGKQTPDGKRIGRPYGSSW